jgi:putative ATPase
MTSPLAERLRPKNFDEIVGQSHIFGEKNIISNLTDANTIPSMIFYGPPGTGKTTTAQIISQKTDKRFFKLNATSASLADIKNILSEINPITDPNGIILYIDEVQYFNKKQQNHCWSLWKAAK